MTSQQLIARIAADLDHGMPAWVLAEEIDENIGAGAYDYSETVLDTAHRCLARLRKRAANKGADGNV